MRKKEKIYKNNKEQHPQSVENNKQQWKVALRKFEDARRREYREGAPDRASLTARLFSRNGRKGWQAFGELTGKKPPNPPAQTTAQKIAETIKENFAKPEKTSKLEHGQTSLPRN